MKKVILVLLLCFTILGLTDCGYSAQLKENSVGVKVINACEEDIYGIGYTYYVNGQIVSSGGACNADNSAFKTGDEISVETDSFFIDNKSVEIEFSVSNKSGIDYPCASKIYFDLQSYILCEIVLIGDFENGFDVVVKEYK